MALIAVIVGVVGVISIMSMKQADLELYEKNALGLQYSGAAAVCFQQLRYDAIKMNGTDISDKGTLNELADDIGIQAISVEEYLSACEGTVTSDTSAEIRTLLEIIRTDWTEYRSSIQVFVETFLGGDKEKGSAMVAPIAALGTTLRDNYITLFDQISIEAKAREEDNNALAQVTTMIMMAVIVAGIIISVLLGIFIARIISKSLIKMVKVAGLLASGDLNIDSVLTQQDMTFTQRRDEIGKLAGAFQDLIKSTRKQVNMAQRVANADLTVDVEVRSDKDLLNKELAFLTESLNKMVSEISAASEQVAAASKQVSDSSMELSQGATEQASAIEELTATVEEIFSQTKLNAENADEASDLANSAKSNAMQGDSHMKEMLNAMDEINVSSSNISKIIKVIDDIAFQTNILALNAAVEAARAGSAGKGFAVVADEVKNLAQKSAEAAKETTSMIENSINKVEDGTKIANETAVALSRIVDDIEKVANLIKSIAVASNEQAVGIEQINQGIVQVTQVVQANSAASEESAAASEELSGQAELLRQLVSRFKLKGAEKTKSSPKSDVQHDETTAAEPVAALSKEKKEIVLSGYKIR